MRKGLFLLILSCAIPPKLLAQRYHFGEVPRYEVGLQFDFNYLDGVGDWGGGFGGRFHYNFNEHFALDSQIIFRQHDVSVPMGTAVGTGAIGQTTGLFGLRAGQRVQDIGFFLRARAGFLHFGSDNGVSLLSRNTFPAFDVGGALERYTGPMILRFEMGELIVAYGECDRLARTVSSSAATHAPGYARQPRTWLGNRLSFLIRAHRQLSAMHRSAQSPPSTRPISIIGEVPSPKSTGRLCRSPDLA